MFIWLEKYMFNKNIYTKFNVILLKSSSIYKTTFTGTYIKIEKINKKLNLKFVVYYLPNLYDYSKLLLIKVEKRIYALF